MYSEQGYCMICGDMNLRSECLQDYIEYDANGDIKSMAPNDSLQVVELSQTAVQIM